MIYKLVRLLLLYSICTRIFQATWILSAMEAGPVETIVKMGDKHQKMIIEWGRIHRNRLLNGEDSMIMKP